MKGDTLSIIAGACRNHSSFAFCFTKCNQLLQSAALLERARALQVLEFEVQCQTWQFGVKTIEDALALA